MLLTKRFAREFFTEALLISFSGGFLAWYVWAKFATLPGLA